MPHLARRASVQDELRKTDLEWTGFYNGYFLDYYGLPYLKSHLQPFPFAIDIANKAAAIPGTGNEKMVFTYTYDIAKFVAEALILPHWEEETVVIGDRLSLNEFVSLAEEARGQRLSLRISPVRCPNQLIIRCRLQVRRGV